MKDHLGPITTRTLVSFKHIGIYILDAKIIREKFRFPLGSSIQIRRYNGWITWTIL